MSSVKRLFGKTKIVCTLGPASSTVERLSSMVHAGMDVARMNFSHGTHDEHLQTLKNLRQAAAASGEPISVIQDLQGPKIRIGELQTPSIELQANAVVTITNKDQKGNEKILSTTYTNLPKDVKPGDRVL